MSAPFRTLASVRIGVALLATAANGVLAADTPPRPGPPPGTCTITPPADSIRIPFEMFRDEIRLTGHIHDQEVRMLVDNGALWDELLFFGSPRVDALGLKREGEAQVGGAGSGDPVLADFATDLSLRFDGEDGRTLEFQNQTAIITPYDPDRPNPWEGSEGQVSAALFKRFVVAFDFDGGVKLPENLTKTLLGVGAQGEIYDYHGTVQSVELGGHRFRDVLATYSTVEDGGSKVDEVMIGMGIFERFHIVFDYPRHRLFVKPNRRYLEPFVVAGSRNSSG